MTNRRGLMKNQKPITPFMPSGIALMLIPAYVGRKSKIQVLISQHSDGEYIARVIKRLGLVSYEGQQQEAVCGQSRPRLIRFGGYPVALPSMGRKVPGSVVHLPAEPGSRQKNPITHHSNGGRVIQLLDASSWDKFSIPKPFSRALMLYGDPIHIPPNLNDEEMERYRLF